MWHKLQGGSSSWVPMFTVAQMDHQLKPKMSRRSEFLFKIFVLHFMPIQSDIVTSPIFFMYHWFEYPTSSHPFEKLKKKVQEWYGGASHTYLTTELLTRREDDRTYIQ